MHQGSGSDSSGSSSGAPLTRADVAKTLGINKSAVIRLEKAGKLHPFLENGVWLFHERDVKKLAGTRPIVRCRKSTAMVSSATEVDGKLAARLFECFRRRMKLTDVVIQCEVHPTVVLAYQAHYARLEKTILLSAEAIAYLENLPGAKGRIRSLEDLVDVLTRPYLASERGCGKCGGRFYCAACMSKMAADSLESEALRAARRRSGGRTSNGEASQPSGEQNAKPAQEEKKEPEGPPLPPPPLPEGKGESEP